MQYLTMPRRTPPQGSAPRHSYRAPSNIFSVPLKALLARTGRDPMTEKQFDLLRAPTSTDDVEVFYSGDLSLLSSPCVSIVGARDASEEGLRRAGRLAKELVAAGVVVVSGLAKGIDHAAHTSALKCDGRTIAVVGTPLDKAYPAENATLQEKIYRDNLLISPFRVGEKTFKGSFPKRNRVMAAISDATVIVEASDTSGTLHQAAECGKLNRWLFIAKSVVDNKNLTWPKKFISQERVEILSETSDIIYKLRIK